MNKPNTHSDSRIVCRTVVYSNIFLLLRVKCQKNTSLFFGSHFDVDSIVCLFVCLFLSLFFMWKFCPENEKKINVICKHVRLTLCSSFVSFTVYWMNRNLGLGPFVILYTNNTINIQ